VTVSSENGPDIPVYFDKYYSRWFVASRVVDQLSHFEAPTGFAIAANSATASLNDRKELLDDLDLLNRVGRKQDDITLTDDYDLFIGGMRLTEINATLE
jgi:hypothetical protein